MKTVDTLVADMENVIMGEGSWDDMISVTMAANIDRMAGDRFSKPQEPRTKLSMSSLGSQCDRQLWYKFNQPELAIPLRANTLLKFFYGDMIEELALCIAQQAGHTVTGQQDKMEIDGIFGSRDCVIDGMTVDVKSASPYSFQKFKSGSLREQDPFGYISQLSSYVYAARNDPLVVNKFHGAFLVIDKVNGHICLDMYDFTEEMEGKREEVQKKKDIVASKMPPERGFEDIPQSKTSPNRKLDMNCSYCQHKKACWPGLKLFAYSNGPTYITELKKPLQVQESEDWT
tara:strand:+ start:2083 stop:2943 length:861 start_codon:yes stop_codon:yes gene_type:complete